MEKKNIILVPTDFSEVAEFAIEHGAGLSKQLSYKLTLLHVINKETKSQLKKDKLSESVINEKLQAKADELSKKHGITVDFIAKEGSIFSTISNVAKEIGANILTMGTHGAVGVQKFIGSYALKVIESLDVPIIVVQNKAFGEGYKDLVLPMDDTMESKQKVKWAIHIARKFKSTVHIFSMNSSEAYRSSKIKANTLQIMKFFEQNDIKYTQKNAPKSGNFPKQILSYSAEINANLIIIMTSPDKLMPKFIVGAWEEEILFNESQIPVLCANPVDLNIVVGGM
jgi:nucleotide-binding universal stress UspA family protein